MMARAALNNLANATAGRSAQIPHAARPSLGARCNRYRAALRLGWRDALRHKARTLLSLLLVMLPIAAGGLHRYDHHHTAHQIACAGDNPG